MPSPRLALCEPATPEHRPLESLAPFGLKAHCALRLCGLRYERRHAPPPSGFGHASREAPVLWINDEPVTDSTRIVSYVDALSGHALCAGLDARGRAEAFLWEQLADSALSGFVEAARWIEDENWPRTRAALFGTMPGLMRAILPERVRASKRQALWARDVIRPDLAACRDRFEELLGRLEARAPRDGYWLGTTPSRADVAIYAQLWSLRAGLTPDYADRLARKPGLTEWLERVHARCVSAAVPRRDREAPAAPEASRLAVNFG